MAEYEALIAGLGLAQKFGATSLKIVSDSYLVVHQVNRTYMAKCPTMAEYLKNVKELMRMLEKVKLKQLPREKNSQAHALANVALAVHLAGKRTIAIELILNMSISKDSEVLNLKDEGQTWMKEIVDYIVYSLFHQTSLKLRSYD